MTAMLAFLGLLADRMAEGYCPNPKPDETQHCMHWWDCEPCHWCGFDGGGEDCDCDRHSALRGEAS